MKRGSLGTSDQLPSPAPTASDGLSIVTSLHGMNIFITGATGFVGKVLVEKILRSIPNCGELILLVRPNKGSTAADRCHKEVVLSPVFNRLRSERKDFDSYIKSKLHVVAGELTRPEMGLGKEDLAYCKRKVNVVIHVAAITDFNERIDKAIEMNVMGTMRCFDMAQSCDNLKAFIHMSTCYVNSNKRGWIEERLYDLNFDVESVLKRVESMSARELDQVTGIRLDWPNTYTFTKAMTEHLLMKRRGTTPIGIIRPSIIGSSWQEPVPGWVDAITAAGAVYVASGMGVLKALPGRLDSIADLIPVDYVVNATLALIPAVFGQDKILVTQAASSVENPLHWGVPTEVVVKHWRDYPPARAIGKCSFAMVSNPHWYQIQFFMKYSVPSAILTSFSQFGSSANKAKAALINKLVWRIRVLVESFRYFTENEWLFDNRNVRILFSQLTEAERSVFPLDLSSVNWHVYHRAFAYGLNKFVLKNDDLQLATVNLSDQYIHYDEWTAKPSELKKWAPNLEWSIRKFNEYKAQNWPKPRTAVS